VNLQVAELVSIGIYKIASLASGSAMCFLGYRLFVLGIVSPAGDMTAVRGKSRLVLKAAAPGTFFAVLGAVVLLATVMKGFQTNLSTSLTPIADIAPTIQPTLRVPELPPPPIPQDPQKPAGQDR
jgi:hypothetical protein